MRQHRGPILLIPALLLLLLLAACSSKSSPGGGGSSSSGGVPSATATSGGGGSSASIVAQGFAFSPNSVTVSAGKVTITVTNKDTVMHTFTLDDGSSSTNLEPGKTTTITLDISATVGWHCNIHPSMTGTLNVG